MPRPKKPMTGNVVLSCGHSPTLDPPPPLGGSLLCWRCDAPVRVVEVLNARRNLHRESR